MKLSTTLGLALAACGGTDPTPDAASGPIDITISVFTNGAQLGGPTANAQLVAAQDGDGAWQALAGTDGIYHATISSERYAVAVACPPNPDVLAGATVSIYARTRDDGDFVAADGCFAFDTGAGRIKLTVTVPNLGEHEHAEVWAADTFNYAYPDSPATLEVLPGHIDMMIRKRTSEATTTSLVYRTALDLTADKEMTVDLAMVGKPPDHLPLSLSKLDANETARVSTSFAPGIGFAGIQMPLEGEPLASPPRFAVIPTALRLPKDVSNVTVTATKQTGTRTDERFVRLAMSPPRVPTITLPPPIVFPAPKVGATPLRRATVTFPLTQDTARPRLNHLQYTALLETTDSTGLINASWALTASPTWSTDKDALTFSMPDLSALPGWSPALALQPGPVSWTLERDEGNMPFDAAPHDTRLFLGNVTSDTLP